MTAIWRRVGDGYERLVPAGFPSEAVLHKLVEEAPETLPLAGSPDLMVLGIEVPLGGGYADILAVENSGQFVLIEIKLVANGEARRAVVAQLLSYASHLRGRDLESLERTLARKLRSRGAATIAALAAEHFQDPSLDGEAYRAALQESLDSGAFRLVWVLDEAPDELASTVGYLEAISSGVTIDLVVVGQYEIGEERVIVPQRVEPARVETQQGELLAPVETDGADDFTASIDVAQPPERALLKRLAVWAKDLERQGLAELYTTSGTSGRKVLKPCIPDEGVGLVTIFNDGRGTVAVWRTRFEVSAPAALARLESAGVPVSQGNNLPEITEDILAMLTEAYREAAAGA